MSSEPTEGAGMIEFLAWLEVNKKRLAWAAAVLIVVGFATYVWSHMAEQKEANAAAALAKLRTPMNAETNTPPIPSSEYLKVAEQYPNAKAAERAILLGATTLFTEGKYPEAQNQFDRLIKEHPASPWIADAAFGIAASLESQGKRDDALTAYQRVVTSYGSEPVANQARLALARMYEAKSQPDLALKQYEEITKPGGLSPMSQLGQEALNRREKLLKKFPNLVKPVTNAPAMTMGTNLPVMKPATNAIAPSTNKPAGAK